MGGSCPCVTQKGFAGARGQQDQANVIRIITNQHDKDARLAVGQAVAHALTEAGLKPQEPRSIDAVVSTTEGHSVILVGVILLIASTIGIVGLIGLGSTMSTNVIERTREFGVMKAIGASGSKVARLVVFEGVFIAAVSCLVALHKIALVYSGVPQEIDTEAATKDRRPDFTHSSNARKFVKLLNPQPDVDKALEKAGMKLFFKVYKDLESAIQSF
jgi:hypothetical protein